MKESGFIVSRPEGHVVYTFDEELLEASVIERPNRFVVSVRQDSRERRCHLHDPGRLMELIYPGARVLIRNRKGEKTDCSIVAGFNNGRWILTDSRIHSEIASKFLPEGTKSEVKIGRKRLDFNNGKMYVEVKGSTLSMEGISVFPDAPTVRGREHLQLLRRLKAEGKSAMILILVFRDDTRCFLPNEITDPEFSGEFYGCIEEGVELKVLRFRLEGNSIIYSGTIGLCKREDSRIFRNDQ